MHDVAEHADLLRPMLAAGLRTSQCLVGAGELDHLLGRSRRLVLGLVQAARGLLLLGPQQRLQPTVAQLVQGQEALRERLAAGAGGEEQGQAAAVEHPHRERAQGEADPGLRRRPRLRRLLPQQLLDLALPEVAQQTVDVARAESAKVARVVGHEGRDRPHPRFHERIPMRPQMVHGLLEGGGERHHAGRSPWWRQAMPPVSRRQRTAVKPARCMSDAKSSGAGKRATEAGR